MEINELKQLFDLQISSKRFHSRCHQNDIVVEVLVELLNVYRVCRGSGDQFEFQGVVASSHFLDVVEEDRVGLQGSPSVYEDQGHVL